MKTLSIKQYQNQFPRVSAVPSITQSGNLAAVLERIDQKQARLGRRRAFRKEIVQRSINLVQALQQRFARRAKPHTAIATRRSTI